MYKRQRDLRKPPHALNSESMKIGLKMHKGKTKYMTNYDSLGTVKIDGNEIEEVPKYKIFRTNCKHQRYHIS